VVGAWLCATGGASLASRPTDRGGPLRARPLAASAVYQWAATGGLVGVATRVIRPVTLVALVAGCTDSLWRGDTPLKPLQRGAQIVAKREPFVRIGEQGLPGRAWAGRIPGVPLRFLRFREGGTLAHRGQNGGHGAEQPDTGFIR
jgi:hypothetical protein